jgi:hypothetical protein
MGASSNHPRFPHAFARSEKWFHPNAVLFRPPIARETERVFPDGSPKDPENKT